MSKSSRKSLQFFFKYNRLLTGMVFATTVGSMATTAYAQQAGSVVGTVTQADGSIASGVTIEASSPVLPQARTTVTDANGRYQLPLLPPGEYEITFRDGDGNVTRRSTMVLLQQRRDIDITLGGGDEIIVIGQKIEIDTASASLKNSISNQIIEGVPVGQEYRDLQKLIPGVQYSEDQVRGPSAGGSGQDNTYQFDGVDVSLPLFGNLSAEPSTHDIDQVSVVRGGATAIGFNRSGGFTINTISKRGTNEFTGEIQYKIQTSGMTADRDNQTLTSFDEDRSWLTANIGGPVIRDRLYFYGSYYRPEVTRENGTNALGNVPDYESTRDEYFGKLTFSPASNLTFDASYRTSDREVTNASIGALDRVSTSEGSDAQQDIAIIEGSWIIDDVSNASFKFTDFDLQTSSRPDTIIGFTPTTGQSLDVLGLDTQGFFRVPTLRTGTTPDDLAFNAAAAPVIALYGQEGIGIGAGTTINEQDFYRTSFEANYNRVFTLGAASHEIHLGYQFMEIEEVLSRSSNGFGSIDFIGGVATDPTSGTPIHYRATFTQPVAAGVGQVLRSSSELQSFEINDTIETGPWTFNVGILFSNDTLFGQGLREDSSTLSGYALSPGTKYKMYETEWSKMIQPRLGVNYEYNDTTELYANYARYNPSASSLARAASWDRNILGRRTEWDFDINGNFIADNPIGSSSGKLFVPDMDPRFVDEYLLGANKQVSDELGVRVHYRYREAGNFWEDTPNNARLYQDNALGNGGAPADIQALGLYIPDLDAQRAQIGSGSSYVVATLDNAYTEYNELGFEADYRTDNFLITGSYVWSQYRGNFDQDNTTGNNDQNIFIGSSNIADGAGRQVWDMKDGTLSGDRPHQFKVYGVYELPWDAQIGGFAIYQSGKPWETWDFNPYLGVIRPGSSNNSSRSTTIRFAEPAGSNRSDAHYQLDMNYTQNFEVLNGYNVQFRADLFNVFNKQTGYNIQPRFNSSLYGQPLSAFNPRRLRLAVKASF